MLNLLLSSKVGAKIQTSLSQTNAVVCLNQTATSQPTLLLALLDAPASVENHTLLA